MRNRSIMALTCSGTSWLLKCPAPTVCPTTSAGHSDPMLLQRVIELAEPKPADRALDIATGAGHTALVLAPHVAEVVAFDLTQQMLEETARNATARCLTNVTTR